MAATLDTPEKQVLTLPPSSRVRLAERILESVDDFTDPSIARAWEAEIGRRVKEIREGKAKPIPAEEAMANARRALHEVRRVSSARRK
jgi:putative addiction module component (TIGR02574 family)